MDDAPDFIPYNQVPAAQTQPDQNGEPPDFIPTPQAQTDEQKYDAAQEAHANIPDTIKTAVEQGVAGATLGGSKILETQGIPALGIPAITTPEAIAEREKAHPIASFLAGTAGTGALLTATGGLGLAGLAGEGAGLAAKIGVGAAQGALIGGANSATDDWSQNKSVDGQKLVASAGLGTAIGGVGSAFVEGILPKFLPKAVSEVTQAVNEQPGAAVLDVPTTAAKAPETMAEVQALVDKGLASGDTIALPQKAALEEANAHIKATDTEKYPILQGQLDSLESQAKRNAFKSTLETPGYEALPNYQALQKNEAVGKINQAIQDIAPGVTSDAQEASNQVIDAATKAYKTEQAAIAPTFEALKNVPYNGNLAQDMAVRVSNIPNLGPKISQMMEVTPEGVKMRPFNEAIGVTPKAYEGVKSILASAERPDTPKTVESLWNLRGALDSKVDLQSADKNAGEIRTIKAALMDQMQDQMQGKTTIPLRDAFRRNAINESNRAAIEDQLGASIARPDLKQSVKDPLKVLDRIFSNVNTVDNYKSYVSPEDFNLSKGNWLAQQASNPKTVLTQLGGFRSNAFGNILNGKRDVLRAAFAEDPSLLQKIQAWTTKARILPDDVSNNPSGTAKTLVGIGSKLLKNSEEIHKTTWEGAIAKIALALPEVILKKTENASRLAEVNAMISGNAEKAAGNAKLQKITSAFTKNLDNRIKTTILGTTSQTRKAVNGR